MRVICAWCHAIVQAGQQGDETTHTMCAGCTPLTDDERDTRARLYAVPRVGDRRSRTFDRDANARSRGRRSSI
jgi:hypothetical protein